MNPRLRAQRDSHPVCFLLPRSAVPEVRASAGAPECYVTLDPDGADELIPRRRIRGGISPALREVVRRRISMRAYM
jgi:hypothetical protein